MGEFVDELPPSIPPRPGGPSSSYPSAYPSIGTGGYSAYTAPGLNSSLYFTSPVKVSSIDEVKEEQEASNQPLIPWG